MTEPRIVILGRDDETTQIVYNYLAKQFPVSQVVLEESVGGLTVLKRRAKRLGFLSALGQGLFVKLIMPLLLRAARKRIRAIMTAEQLSTAALPTEVITSISSINDTVVFDVIKEQQPTHIIVNGTRLIGKQLLDQLTMPIINIHLGWNPRYRGGNGAYWALWNSDQEHAGVTVHLIDAGIDTGSVLARSVIAAQPTDNFMSYPYLQLAAGLKALVAILKTKTLETTETHDEPSRIWYHPTLWGYFWARLTRGIR